MQCTQGEFLRAESVSKTPFMRKVKERTVLVLSWSKGKNPHKSAYNTIPERGRGKKKDLI